MKKLMLICILLLGIKCSFAQTTRVVNPTVPFPRPQLSPEDILKGKLQDFNPVKTNDSREKPSGVRQRMIATATRTISQGSPFASDSTRYTYSGNRGSFPSSTKGNVTTNSLVDSFYPVPTDMPYAPQSPVDYGAYEYNDRNLPVHIKYYDSAKRLVDERWIEYFPNDSLQNFTQNKVTFYSNSSVNFSRQTVYNDAGTLTRDSMITIFVYNGVNGASSYNVKNVNFDSLGRISSIDSTYRQSGSSLSYWVRRTLKNSYSSSNAVYPFKDSIISVMYDMTPGAIDTTLFQVNDYEYNSSNLLIRTTLYNDGLSSIYPQGLQPFSRESYTYNSNGQILTSITQYYSNGAWSNSLKEVYEYTHNINTSYIQYSYLNETSFNEIIKSISVLNASDIIDSVKTYDQGVCRSITTFSFNSFGNRSTEKYFDLSFNGTPNFYNNMIYYYDEFDDPTAVNEIKEEQRMLHIFPNPAGNSLNYQIENKPAKYWMLFVYDLSGKMLYKASIAGTSGIIDISKFKPGVYTFSILDPENRASQNVKFVKE